MCPLASRSENPIALRPSLGTTPTTTGTHGRYFDSNLAAFPLAANATINLAPTLLAVDTAEEARLSITERLPRAMVVLRSA
mmetsp:Transcript_4048/g.14387  ORF Transcript_4048/g.14387 Transcript_4048/m.14387 type:complete len:81 (-) Transcript_4048:1395-1637(-)